MMNTIALLLAAAIAPWQNPEVNSINRLPPRAVVVPCQSEEVALGILQRDKTRNDSKWIKSLNGEWDFKWKRSPERDWEKSAKITVPGCWQLQGEYDPPLYSNIPYPIASTPPDPMQDPPKNYTSYEYRNPVGLYTCTFKRPWSWWFRRTVLHFNGVSSAMYVRVNGKEVGYSEDSRLPAEFDITPYLNIFVANTLEVEVYKHCDGTYVEDQDFWRLSGIFRDVWLVSEHKDAPKDFVIETTLTDDYGTGTFVIRDEKGNELKRRVVESPRLWSSERPYVYITPWEFKHGWWIFGGTEYYAFTLGFRKVEIKDSVLYLNGKRVLFKGTDRHEMRPEGGYAITLQDMDRDIRIMKELNINAVRTSHYPNDPAWYDLCDTEGIMVVCEANIESHGMGYGDKTLAKRADYLKTHVERGTNMVMTLRNHPSILIWSMGNEAGDGPNFEAEYKAIRAIDPTRPIQYERAMHTDHSDIMCPMYTRPWDCESYVKNSPAKPFILCEYTHAMGNSNGGIQKYWDLARKYPSFQGGFIWDFVDQAVWKTDSNGTWLAYGGDFSDKPNDDNFNCNGFVAADRTLHPGAYEIKHAYQPISVESYDWKSGKAVVRNGHVFIDLEDYDGEWRVTRGGTETCKGALDLDGIAPETTKELTLAAKDGDVITFSFYKDGEIVAWSQFAKPFTPAKIDTTAAQPLADHPFKYNFWRAPTDNDRGWNMPAVCKPWKNATADQELPPGVTSDLKVSRMANGDTFVDWTLTVPKGLPPIPRVGLSFTVPAANVNAQWYGLGPWENYCDRATGALLGVHAATVGLTSGLADPATGRIAYAKNRLNPDNYIEPGEQGYRTGCRWLKLADATDATKAVTVTAVNAPFGFNAWPYPQTMLEGKKHQWQLEKGDAITVNVDAAQMGVSGDNSWGARPHDEFQLKDGTYRLSFIVSGL